MDESSKTDDVKFRNYAAETFSGYSGTKPWDNCGTCIHAELETPGSKRGYCRRYPPAARKNGKALYPVILKTWICGEHKVA